jgi:membrane dipeptidase
VATRRWFDGHLDLTYIADHGRDLTKDASDGGTPSPAAVTFPALRNASVAAAVSTLFVRRRVPGDPARNADPVNGPYCFDTPDQAHAAALRQLDMHAAWEQAGWIERAAHGPMPPRPTDGCAAFAPLRVTLAMEGAACLRTVDDLDPFVAAGVKSVALAWAEGSAWAGGDATGGDVTPDGRRLIRRLDDLGVVHDVSHLSERAFWTLLETAAPAARIIASHSNCRSLLPGAKSPERHLSDDQIRALAARERGGGGVIGVNLFARFLIPPDELKHRRATIADVVRHVEHIARLTGSRRGIALGSDMDSGFTTDLLPEDLTHPTHLPRLADALAAAGWSDADIDQFAWRAWSTLYTPPPPPSPSPRR